MKIEFEIDCTETTFGELAVGARFQCDGDSYIKTEVINYDDISESSFVGYNPSRQNWKIVKFSDEQEVELMDPVEFKNIKVGEFFSPDNDPETIWIRSDDDYVRIVGSGDMTAVVYKMRIA
jgi:hypothetical protein